MRERDTYRRATIRYWGRLGEWEEDGEKTNGSVRVRQRKSDGEDRRNWESGRKMATG